MTEDTVEMGYVPAEEMFLMTAECYNEPYVGKIAAFVVTDKADKRTVLSFEIVEDIEAARNWFVGESILQPWVKRS